MRFLAVAFTVLLALGETAAGPAEIYAARIASLVDPAKLATLKALGANPRVQKAVYWLATARSEGASPTNVLSIALKTVGMK